MKELLMAALVVGTFSGVDIEHLMEKPILGSEALVEAAGEELLEHGEGMALEERDDRTVAVTTDRDFYLEFTREFDQGSYVVEVEATAPGRGSDSYWIVVDGEQLSVPITPPVGTMGKRAGGFRIAEEGEHTVRLILREAPGSAIAAVRLVQTTLQPPRDPMIPELADQHPRMLFTADDIEAMRARLDDETVQQYYKPAGVLTREPPPFKPGKRNGGSFRGLPAYALSHVLEPEPEKLEALIEWLDMATTYPHCGVDLDAEYFMEGVALSYDWLYDELPEDLRKRVRDTICRQARTLYEASLAGHTGGRLNYQQNHYWFAHLSLIFAASAVYGEVPEARDWLAWGWDRVERIFITFSPDGGFHEGPAYWDYSMPTLYMLVSLYEQLTGLDVPWADRGLHGQAVFRFHHMFPGMQHSASLEDTTVPDGLPRTQLLLWEAKRYQDPVVMGIAQKLSGGPSNHPCHLLWLDETVEPADPFAEVPVAQYYDDIETVFARTSWDEDATFAAFVSRPLGGHLVAELCERYGIGGTGHNHPEQGHFVLFGHGEVLAHDPGYTYEKKTSNHSTILVDGEGQYGDGETWPRPTPGRAHMTGFAHEADLTIAAADPSSAYPDELGLERFERTFVLAGRELVVVYDRLRATQPRTFSWLLQHIGSVEVANHGCTVTRGDAQLAVIPLRPDEVEINSERYLPEYVHPSRDHTPDEDAEIGRLKLVAGPVEETTFLVPMVIGAAGDELPSVERLSGESFDGVRVGQRVVAFNRGEAEMSVPLPWGETLSTTARAVVASGDDGEQRLLKLEWVRP